MKPTAKKQCVWRPDHEGPNVWQSQCGLLWGLANDASPKENQMNYCPKCGKELIEDLKNAPQRYKESLGRMDGKNGRKNNEGS